MTKRQRSAGRQLLTGKWGMIGISTETHALDLLNVQFMFAWFSRLPHIASSTRAREEKQVDSIFYYLVQNSVKFFSNRKIPREV